MHILRVREKCPLSSQAIRYKYTLCAYVMEYLSNVLYILLYTIQMQIGKVPIGSIGSWALPTNMPIKAKLGNFSTGYCQIFGIIRYFRGLSTQQGLKRVCTSKKSEDAYIFGAPDPICMNQPRNSWLKYVVIQSSFILNCSLIFL